jgi:hypothetical protein
MCGPRTCKVAHGGVFREQHDVHVGPGVRDHPLEVRALQDVRARDEVRVVVRESAHAEALNCASLRVFLDPPIAGKRRLRTQNGLPEPASETGTPVTS